MKILVVGAGPSGLTAAIALKQKGFDVHVIEKRDGPHQLAKAITVFPDTVELLNTLGVGQEIVSKAHAIHQIDFHSDKKKLGFIDKKDQSTIFYLIPQWLTEEILANRVSNLGININYSTWLTDIDNGDSGATITFNDGRQQAYDFVIGADGIHSDLRAKLGVETQQLGDEERWRYIHAKIDKQFVEHTGRMYGRVGDHNIKFTVARMYKDEYVILVFSDKGYDDINRLLGIKEEIFHSEFSVVARSVDGYLHQSVFFIGDAAHCVSPLDGKGMNMGIHDAFHLAEAIENNTIKTYADRLAAENIDLIKHSEYKRKSLLHGSSIINAMKSLGLIGLKIPFIRAIAFKNYVSFK